MPMTSPSNHVLLRLFNKITDGAAFAAGVVLAFITLIVCIDVFMRYFLNRPVQGAMETSEFGLTFLTLLASAWLLRKDKHVRMELLLHKLKPRTQAWVNSITSMICVLTCVLVFYYGLIVVVDRFKTGHRLMTTLEPLSYPLMAIVPVCFFLLTIQFILEAHRYFQEAKNPTKTGTRVSDQGDSTH
jgi:TRAP-type C4-dicarboxylate transport system permease small subunit